MIWDLHNQVEDVWNSFLSNSNITIPYIYKQAEVAVIGEHVRFPNLCILCSSSSPLESVKYIAAGTPTNRIFSVDLIISTAVSNVAAKVDHAKFVSEIYNAIYIDNLVEQLNSQEVDNIWVDVVRPPSQQTIPQEGCYQTTITIELMAHPVEDNHSSSSSSSDSSSSVSSSSSSSSYYDDLIVTQSIGIDPDISGRFIYGGFGDPFSFGSTYNYWIKNVSGTNWYIADSFATNGQNYIMPSNGSIGWNRAVAGIAGVYAAGYGVTNSVIVTRA